MRHRTARPVTRPALTVAALVITLSGSACSAGDEDQSASARHSGAVTATSQGSASSSPLPPIAPITPAAPAPTSRPAPDGPLVESATWADSDYGATLKISPTEAGRLASGVDDARTAWREVLAQVPDADAPGMWEQFDCHWTWARILEPDKATWNVEPWRPVVDEAAMIADGCNPGGPEV